MSKAADIAGTTAPTVPERLSQTAGWLLVASAFFLPLKWGTLAAMSEAAGFFPERWHDYIFITWPAHSVWVCGGGLLLLMLFSGRVPDFRTPGGIMALLWGIGLPVAALPGCFVPGRDVDFAWGEAANIAGLGAWTLAVYLIACSRSGVMNKAAAAFMLGILLTALNGFHQYFFGFAEMKEFVANQIASGVNVPESLLAKLADTRITSFMASSNALAGILLISLPLIGFFAVKWGKNFTPPGVSSGFFMLTGWIIAGGALLLCRARSSLLVLLCAGLTAVFSAPGIRRKWKIAAAAAAVAVLCGGAFFAMHYGRGFGSILERADYLRTTAVLVKEHPLAGSGWGGFFYRHMEIKLSAVKEASRDPHNMVAAFAGQSGIPAGAVALAALIFPLAVLWKKRFSWEWDGAVFWCGLLFTLHILMDCDMHIPAITGGMAILYLSALECREYTGKFSVKAALILLMLPVAAGAIWSNIHLLRGEAVLADFTEYLSPSTADSASARRLPMEHFENAAAAFRPQLALIPELAGDWYMTRGEPEKARQRYLHSLKLNPRRPGIYRRLAVYAAMQGEREQAAAWLKQAAARFPRNPKYSPEHPENRAMLQGRKPMR